MKRFRDFAVFLFFSLGFFIIIVGALFNYYLSPISNNKVEKEIQIKDGHNIDEVAATLYAEKLIRNPKVFKIYIKINSIEELKTGSFMIKQNMSSPEIIKYLSADKQ